VTAPAAAPPQTLAPLLSLVDASTARGVAAEDQLVTESDNLYAQRYTAYLAEEEKSQKEEDTHPFLNAALLAAVVVLLRRSFASGSAEGLRFGEQQLTTAGIPFDPSAITVPTSFIDSVVQDFLAGQVDAASKASSQATQSLVLNLAQRARTGVLVAYHGGRGAATEATIASAAAQWTGAVHKLWIARFDLETPPCPLCVRLHGTHVPVADDFHVPDAEPTPYLGKLARPPRHPRCRCSLVLYLPTKMDSDSGPTPLSMMQYANHVLGMAGLPQHDFVEATVVRVEGYTRVVDGKTEQVSGYFYNIKTGLKVPASKAVGHKAPKVSLQKARAMEQKAKLKGDRKSSLGSEQAAVWSKGTYHINMPDGSVTQVIVSPDGSSRTSFNGQVENANPAQTQQFMSYWQKNLQRVDGADSGLHDIQHPEHNIGGVSVTSDHVHEAINILKREPSTSVKSPLKNADHPLASADLRGFADTHHGIKHHYSKLKQGVVEALQAQLDAGKQDKKLGKGKIASRGTASKQQFSDSASITNPPSIPSDDLKTWKAHLEDARVALKVVPQAGDHGSGLAAALQRVASTRHKYYVSSDQGNTQISMKPLPIAEGGQSHLVHSNGSVWKRSLDASGVEQLTAVFPDEVSSLTSLHLQSTDKLTLEGALANSRSLKDTQLDTFMQEALVADNIDAFDQLAVEADRRSVMEQRSRAQEEQRALQLEKLLMEGNHESDAIETVYGVSGEGQRRKLAITALRADGYTGVNLNELARKAFRDDVYRRYIEAEDSMQGHMLSKEGEGKNVSPLKLFTGSESTAMKYASPELIDYWELNGRPSFDEWLKDFMGRFGSTGGA
jgi:hypothetical protein